MGASFYGEAPVTVREDLAAAHERSWQRLARPGTWLTAERRLAIAAEARRAPSCALCRERKDALSPNAVAGKHQSLGTLPDNLVEVIHRIRTDPGRLTRGWYDKLLASGLSEEEYVETVGVVVNIVAVDTFARGIGMPLRALSKAEPGAPSRRRPKGVKHGGAWVPWLDAGDTGPDEADLYPPGPPAANIYKAMSLVPDEVRGFFDLVRTQYLPRPAMHDFSREYRAISHAQIELLAARVSAINRCEY